MSNNTIIPTAYFGPIEYYAILSKYKCNIENHEHFVKQSIRNRCEIYSSYGKLTLSIPKVRINSSKTMIKDIKISYAENWQRTHWRAIKFSYNSSPYFQYYKEEIKNIIKKSEISLLDFNLKVHKKILDILKIETKIKLTHEYIKTGDFTDLRAYKFNKKLKEKYEQVFSHQHGFISNLSILDLLFNLGPESIEYLKRIEI